MRKLGSGPAFSHEGVRSKLMGDMNLVFALQRRLAYLAPFTLSLVEGHFQRAPNPVAARQAPRGLSRLGSGPALLPISLNGTLRQLSF
jgi:hypothetical protein